MNTCIILILLILTVATSSHAYQNPLKVPKDEKLGIADPGVIRWMGKYYLYATKVVEDPGIRCWESTDLVNWKLKGRCTGEDAVFGNNMAWSPAVLYYNGKFYLYVSSADQIHRVFEADQPWGPFRCVNDNLLDVKSLDAVPFIDDDGQLYLFYAGWGGIQYRKCSSPVKADGENHMLKACVFSAIPENLWVEGPTLLKRNGIYYLSYCGNDWIKDSYQVQTSKGKNIKTLKPQKSNPLLTQTTGSWVATGCNHIVIGPDMKSLWNVYHCRKSGGGYRKLCLDRIYIDPVTGDLKANGPTWTDTPNPEPPKWYENFDRKDPGPNWENLGGQWKITDSGSVRGKGTESQLLSRLKTSADFAAEFNIRLAEDSRNASYGLILCSEGRNNLKLMITPDSKILELHETIDGSGRLLAKTKIPGQFDLRFWHTIRIDNQDHRLQVFFDDMLKIDTKINIGGGRFGFITSNCSADFGWCGFSDY